MDFDTGKYAAFIWPAFGATAVLLAVLLADSLIRTAYWKRKAETLEAARDAKRKATKP